MRGRSSTSGKEQHLDGKLHFLVPHREGNSKDYAVCSVRKGGKWHGSRFISEICERKPAYSILWSSKDH
jgi:hypothetical protein